MRYLQCSNTWLVDKDTMGFVEMNQRVDPCEVDVPFYFWGYASEWGNYVSNTYKLCANNEYTVMKRVSIIELNHLSIEFLDGYRHAFVKFYDTVKKRPSVIEIDSNPYPYGILNLGGKQTRGMSGLTYVLRIDGEGCSCFAELPRLSSAIEDFEIMPDLGRHIQDGACAQNFCYGVAPTMYTVDYKHRMLNGKSFVMLCGPWAILLTEDMSFDSLVFLNGVRKDHTLWIERFAYTVNPNILKVRMLMG